MEFSEYIEQFWLATPDDDDTQSPLFDADTEKRIQLITDALKDMDEALATLESDQGLGERAEDQPYEFMQEVRDTIQQALKTEDGWNHDLIQPLFEFLKIVEQGYENDAVEAPFMIEWLTAELAIPIFWSNKDKDKNRALIPVSTKNILKDTWRYYYTLKNKPVGIDKRRLDTLARAWTAEMDRKNPKRAMTPAQWAAQNPRRPTRCIKVARVVKRSPEEIREAERFADSLLCTEDSLF